MKHLIILLTLISSLSFAQTPSIDKDKKLTVKVTAKLNGIAAEKTEGITITLLKDSVAISTIKQNIANFNLDVDGNYMISISKPGYNSKSVYVKTTGVPVTKWNKGIEPLEIEGILYTPQESVYTTAKVYMYNSEDEGFMPY